MRIIRRLLLHDRIEVIRRIIPGRRIFLDVLPICARIYRFPPFTHVRIGVRIQFQRRARIGLGQLMRAIEVVAAHIAIEQDRQRPRRAVAADEVTLAAAQLHPRLDGEPGQQELVDAHDERVVGQLDVDVLERGRRPARPVTELPDLDALLLEPRARLQRVIGKRIFIHQRAPRRLCLVAASQGIERAPAPILPLAAG